MPGRHCAATGDLAINKAIRSHVSPGKSLLLAEPQFPHLLTSNQLTNSVDSTAKICTFTISFANTLVQAILVVKYF